MLVPQSRAKRGTGDGPVFVVVERGRWGVLSLRDPATRWLGHPPGWPTVACGMTFYDFRGWRLSLDLPPDRLPETPLPGG